jgi:hypothetical protein
VSVQDARILVDDRATRTVTVTQLSATELIETSDRRALLLATGVSLTFEWLALELRAHTDQPWRVRAFVYGTRVPPGTTLEQAQVHASQGAGLSDGGASRGFVDEDGRRDWPGFVDDLARRLHPRVTGMAGFPQAEPVAWKTGEATWRSPL